MNIEEIYELMQEAPLSPLRIKACLRLAYNAGVIDQTARSMEMLRAVELTERATDGD